MKLNLLLLFPLTLICVNTTGLPDTRQHKKLYFKETSRFTRNLSESIQKNTLEENASTETDKIEEVLEKLKEENIHFVMFTFCDLMGHIKEITLPINKVKSALINGLSFDSSSIAGYSSISESDMILKPDLSTLRFIPWTHEVNKSAIIICNVYKNPNEPYEADPRFILQQATRQLEQQGYNFYVGPELEFFLFKQDASGNPTVKPCDNKKYTDIETNFSRQQENHILIHTLRQLDIDVEKLHHEVANGQHEMSFRYNNALNIADQIIIAKYALQVVAQQLGYHATFMPKPLFGHNGSGMHIHFSLFDINQNKNAFYSQDEKYNLSPLAQSFIAGNLNYIKELSSILNSTVNSYKRLVPGYEAPVYICWGNKNRSALIRVPLVHDSSAESVRAEIRCPDALTNPYLAFTALLKTGLQGIAENKKLQDPVNENLYKLSQQVIKEKNIQTLPENLSQALDQLETSELALKIFGSKTISEFINIKRKEYQEFSRAVTDWEVKKYL